MGWCSTHTRILKGDTPVFTPYKSKLAFPLMTHLHNEHHHCPYPTTLSLYRSHYHTTKACVLSKSVPKTCRICLTDQKRLPLAPPLLSIPTSRTEISPAFTHIELDVMSAYLTDDRRKPSKAYVMVVTCLTTRGVYLDLTPNLTVA